MNTSDYPPTALRDWVSKLQLSDVERRIICALLDATESQNMSSSSGQSPLGQRCWLDRDDLARRTGLSEGDLLHELWDLYGAGFIEEPLRSLPGDTLVLELLRVLE
jgi:hypothetical protein